MTLRYQDLERLSVALQKDIELYVLHDSPNIRLFHAKKKKFKNAPLRLLVDDGEKSPDTVIWPILIIHNERAIAKDQVCPNPGCYYQTHRKCNFDRHFKRCSQAKTPITSKQTAYGQRSDIIWELVEGTYLPKEALNFRKTKFGTSIW